MQARMGWHRLGWTVLALALLAALTAPVADAAERLVVRIDEPFTIQGTRFPAGELAVRQVIAYNPSLVVNEITVDGRSLGMVVAERVPSGPPVDESALNFVRDDDGTLRLVGIDWTGHSSHGSFRLRAFGQG